MTISLNTQVTAFMLAMGQHICMSGPTVPPDVVVRLRARLLAEEMFEFLESLFPLVHWESIESEVMARIGAARVNVDMPAFADACADIDYVVEGARIAFGIRGEPIADAVHDANMTKLLGPIVNGKKLKPAGWKAPDIEGLLREQGWTGGSR